MGFLRLQGQHVTLLTLGGFLPKPTIKMQSAWRTHLCVHRVNVLSHWYKVILNWSSCWANHDINLYSLFGPIIEAPKFLRIMSEVSRKVDAENKFHVALQFYRGRGAVTRMHFLLMAVSEWYSS